MNTKNLISSDWVLQDNPQDKLFLGGTDVLSNADLIAILLGGGADKVEKAKELLGMANNNLCELSKFSIETLVKMGITQNRAGYIIAAMELGRRRRTADVPKRVQIRNSRDIYELFHSKMADLDHEECWVLLMNNQHRIIDCVRISHGGVSETTVDPKIILKHALTKLASSVVLCHNHPSGNPYPSSCDDKITQKLQMACKNLDMQLTDHLVFSESSYYSYADEGKL